MIIQRLGRFYDTEKLKREQFLIKSILENEISDVLTKMGFKRTGKIYVDERTLMSAKIIIKMDANNKLFK